MKNTMTDMVLELEKLTQTEHVKKVIATAKDGQFHDYRSRAVCGKMYAIECLDWLAKTPGLVLEDDLKIKDIRKDIIEGEYDEPFTKDDQEHVFKEVDNDPNISERDRNFFKTWMKTPEQFHDNRGGFGKRYF